ncbi:histidine phosphatase family protein [Halobacillus mangrovi]|uniref:Histidine phosphatase family protein n=1 Tax=Halobacillus mangrovi TaxID=402384 RepID=A0A1W5ZTL2_9BACI|nr:histidine phosphatase family protein [Halobacillus mangrovi]ARI76628.1 histidine phosphatase family protein [Halobacillus mangrovi]
MKLTFIRHGSTQWNKEKRAQGSSDIPLDKEGREDAEKLAERLETEKWDALFSSPLQRAKQTADIISRKVGLHIKFDPRLREAGGGQIEGTTEEERVGKWGENWRSLELGMEKPESVVKRSLSFMEDLAEENAPGVNIIVVSHGGVISYLLRELDPDNIKVEHMKNTSVTEVVLKEGKWVCDRFNCTLHLEK